MKNIVAKIRDENKFKRIVNLGTGGSDLGPRLLADALGDGRLDVRFAANIERNCIHGSDAPETAEVEVGFFFSTADLL